MVVSDTKKHPYVPEDELEGHIQDKEMYDRLREHLEQLEQKRQQELTSYKYSETLYRFAGQAMQGYCANPVIGEYSEAGIAELAVKQAKALLKELEREGNDNG